MEFTIVETLLMAYCPLLVTVLGVIITFIKMVREIKAIKSDNNKSNEQKSQEIKELKNDMSAILEENYALKSQLRKLINKLDRVRDSEVDNDGSNQNSKE